jgi:hypothetical protein
VDAKLVRFQHCPATVIGSGSHKSGRRTRGIKTLRPSRQGRKL